MLNDFLDRWEAASRRHLTESINELIGVMRGADRPIMWVRQEFEPDLRDAFPEMRAKGIRITIKGTSGCQIVPELATDPSDVTIVKKRYSAFHGTILDESLARLQPDALILGGSVLSANEVLFASIQSTLTMHVSTITNSPVKIALARLGGDAALVGATAGLFQGKKESHMGFFSLAATSVLNEGSKQ